jgi:hypothetical protein
MVPTLIAKEFKLKFTQGEVVVECFPHGVMMVVDAIKLSDG